MLITPDKSFLMESTAMRVSPDSIALVLQRTRPGSSLTSHGDQTPDLKGDALTLHYQGGTRI